ncbi:MAG: V-type ATP synthase subunit F [Candidatus Hydrothermarchaeales archaeon]
MNISVVADHTTVTGFRLAGIKDCHEVEKSEDAEEVLRSLTKEEDMGMIIITEAIAEKLRGEIDALIEGKVTPLIVEIPDSKGPLPGKEDPIRRLVKRAVGVEIKYE